MRLSARLVVKEVANGRKRRFEQFVSSLKAGVMGVRAVRPEANAPNGVSLWLQFFTASDQTLAIHRRVLRKRGESLFQGGVFFFPFKTSNGVVQTTNAAADALVLLGIPRAQYAFR